MDTDKIKKAQMLAGEQVVINDLKEKGLMPSQINQNTEKEQPLICEGDCASGGGEHRGKVIEVEVYGNGWKSTKFNYCENAIEEDIKRGFTVEPQGNNKEEVKEDELLYRFAEEIYQAYKDNWKPTHEVETDAEGHPHYYSDLDYEPKFNDADFGKNIVEIIEDYGFGWLEPITRKDNNAVEFRQIEQIIEKYCSQSSPIAHSNATHDILRLFSQSKP